MLVKGPVGIVIFVVPHDENMKAQQGEPAPETELEKLCLGICGGEVLLWLVSGGVPDYVMRKAGDALKVPRFDLLIYKTVSSHLKACGISES